MTETETGHPAGTVKVPGFGQVKKKTAAIVGLGAVGAVLAFIAFRQHQGGSGAAGTAAPAATVTDPAGNVCTAVNPSSGYCPGTPQDQAFLSEQSDALDGGAAAFGNSGGSVGGFDDTGGTGVSQTVGPGTFSNNAEWSQFCESAMGSNGADAIAAALGKYITGGAVTATQVITIDEAIAIGGFPPTQGAGGRPPSINQTGDSTPPPTTPPPAGSPPPAKTPPPTTAPKPGTIVKGTKRHTASGGQTLNQWAASNKTTSGEVISSSDANFTSKYETAANHAKFDVYLNGGTTKKMPKGLVFFSTH